MLLNAILLYLNNKGGVFLVFYDNLKAECDRQGVKLSPLVVECGGALGSIGGWKNGAFPNSDIVIKLALRLGVSTDYLLGVENMAANKVINQSNTSSDNSTTDDLYNSPYVANRIKEYSKLKNSSLKNILETCNLGSNTFSHMLHGKAIAFDSLAKIADYLDCSVDYLLGRTDNPNSHK